MCDIISYADDINVFLPRCKPRELLYNSYYGYDRYYRLLGL